MVSLPQHHRPSPAESLGCGSACGGGLEKVYPTTAVRFGAMNWLGEFRYKSGTVFKCGAKMVIQTERGSELGQQVSLSCNGCSKQVTRDQVKAYVEASGAEFYRLSSGYILREATPADVDEARHLNAHIKNDIDHCAELADRLALDIKIVTAEHLLGGERVVYYFRSEERIDFRALVRELAHHHRTRIEMRQVGARDEARLVADYEICGRECCCKNFLKKLRPVTMRMAKLQKSTLDPSKVSGRCGRLRCRLRYEHIGYEELNAKLPPVGSLVETALGPADVIDRQILTQLLLVRLPDEKQVAIPLEAIKSITLPKDRETRTVVPERPEGADARPSPDRRRRGDRPAAPEPPIEGGARPDRPESPDRPRDRVERPARSRPPRETPTPSVSESRGEPPDTPAVEPVDVDALEQSGTREAAPESGDASPDRRARPRRRRRRHRRGGPGSPPAAGGEGTPGSPPSAE